MLENVCYLKHQYYINLPIYLIIRQPFDKYHSLGQFTVKKICLSYTYVLTRMKIKCIKYFKYNINKEDKPRK